MTGAPDERLLDVIGQLHAALALAVVYVETLPLDPVVDKTAREFVLGRATAAFDVVRRVVGKPE